MFLSIVFCVVLFGTNISAFLSMQSLARCVHVICTLLVCFFLTNDIMMMLMMMMIMMMMMMMKINEVGQKFAKGCVAWRRLVVLAVHPSTERTRSNPFSDSPRVRLMLSSQLRSDLTHFSKNMNRTTSSWRIWAVWPATVFTKYPLFCFFGIASSSSTSSSILLTAVLH